MFDSRQASTFRLARSMIATKSGKGFDIFEAARRLGMHRRTPARTLEERQVG